MLFSLLDLYIYISKTKPLQLIFLRVIQHADQEIITIFLIILRILVIDEMTVRTFSMVILFSLSSHTTLNVQIPYYSIFCGIQAKNFQN